MCVCRYFFDAGPHAPSSWSPRVSVLRTTLTNPVPAPAGASWRRSLHAHAAASTFAKWWLILTRLESKVLLEACLAFRVYATHGQ